MNSKPSTKQRLIEAAENLFLKQGYNGTGVAQILKDADAKSGSLYYFFPTKEHLLLAVLDQYHERVRADVFEKVFDRLGDPLERLAAAFKNFRSFLTKDRFIHGCLVDNLALELNQEHPEARQKIADIFSDRRRLIKRCFDEGADRFPRGTDTEQLALLVQSAWDGAVMLARAYDDLKFYDQATHQVERYLDQLTSLGERSSPSGSSYSSSRRARDASALP